jgi:hypothetical protein
LTKIKTLNYLWLIFLLTTKIFSQGLSDSNGKSFINALINDSPDIEKFVNNKELLLSKRLGITYNDTRNKFLISNDIEPSVKADLRSRLLKYDYSIKNIGDNYSVLTLNIPSKNIKYEYYFHNSGLISKPFYFAKDWSNQKSAYFEFHISDTTLINDYSISMLDTFVDKMISVLNFNSAEIKKLKEEKIHYFFCKDDLEIERLTNYKARGLYYMPYDYIISTYNCHYHELLHLLMNYKLRSVNTYTLPLLQEGFAVAFGGRGGQKPDVLWQMGKFIVQSNILDYKSLLNKSDFNKNDPSMSYPVAGLYVKFLIHSIGINKFLELYKKYSADNAKIEELNINIAELPSDSDWQKYLESPELGNPICATGFKEDDYKTLIINTVDFTIYENKDKYLFRIKSPVGLKYKEDFPDYTSKIFNELYPQGKYQYEKYLVTANAEEVSIYNLFTNDLVAKYVAGFSMKNEPVMQKDGYYIFTVNKNVFDEPV